MPIRRLIYRSRVARNVRYADAEAIAQAAAERNQGTSITGLLLYTPSHFVQVLEGDHDAVTETLARITLDLRHSQLQIIDDREMPAREFDSWAMASRYCAAHASVLEELDSETALALLRGT